VQILHSSGRNVKTALNDKQLRIWEWAWVIWRYGVRFSLDGQWRTMESRDIDFRFSVEVSRRVLEPRTGGTCYRCANLPSERLLSYPFSQQNIIHLPADLGCSRVGTSRCIWIVVFVLYMLFRLRKAVSKYSQCIIHFSCDIFHCFMCLILSWKHEHLFCIFNPFVLCRGVVFNRIFFLLIIDKSHNTAAQCGMWFLLTTRCSLSFASGYLLTYLLTHCMVQSIIWKTDSHSACQKISCFLYGTWRFITVFIKVRHWTLYWGSRIQFAPSNPISLRSILILSSHLRLGLRSGLLCSGLPTKTLYKHLSPPPCVSHVPPTTSSSI
jgi:hypothetical protein